MPGFVTQGRYWQFADAGAPANEFACILARRGHRGGDFRK